MGKLHGWKSDFQYVHSLRHLDVNWLTPCSSQRAGNKCNCCRYRWPLRIGTVSPYINTPCSHSPPYLSPALSQILKKVQSENLTVNGNPLLQNVSRHGAHERLSFIVPPQVFDSEPEKSNFITFRLTRNIAGVVDGGDFTIGSFCSTDLARATIS